MTRCSDRSRRLAAIGALVAIATLVSCGSPAEKPAGAAGPLTVRAGHFPNITHAQGVLGQATGRFQKALGDGAKVSWLVFNAGPSAIEAMFAGELDLTYIGPNPAISGYVRSGGQALRIVSGACSGGAALVIRSDVEIKTPKDFEGKSLATPQLGNTQDVAAKFWLLDHGMDWLERGGKVRVLPLANPDQLTLFQKKELDAAWTVEPWVSRLIQEGNGKLYLDEKDLWPNGRYVITHLIVAKKFLDEHPDVVKAWIAEHVAITDWINANRAEAAKIINTEIKAETGKALPESILTASFARLDLTDDPVSESLFKSGNDAFTLGYLGKDRPNLQGIYDLRLLNEVRGAAGKPPYR